MVKKSLFDDEDDEQVASEPVLKVNEDFAKRFEVFPRGIFSRTISVVDDIDSIPPMHSHVLRQASVLLRLPVFGACLTSRRAFLACSTTRNGLSCTG